ncbi:MAG: protein-disulfide reductase DsbD family protein [Opitutales bacterium]|nr:protein-disulfide reductase DsbD family protein [Opitutales bacterium]
MKLFSIRTFLGIFALAASSLWAEVVETGHAAVELVADQAQVTPGSRFNVALRFELEPHWHLYWKNPGSSGLPLDLEWELPEGVAAGAIQWPTPERIELEGEVTYGFEDVVIFVIPITVDEAYAGDNIAINVDAFWLICKELCLPANASFQIKLPAGDKLVESDRSEIIEAAIEEQPASALPWELSARLVNNAQQAVITVEGAVPDELYFYADAEGVVDPNAKQAFSVVHATSAELVLELDPIFTDEPLPGISGVLQSGTGSWYAEVAFSGDGEAILGKELEIKEMQGGGFEQALLNLGLPGFLALAFIGGLILNVMPCVLPVLSLKVFSLVKHSGQSKGEALAHGGAYSAGVVVSFLALAGALFALRSLGERIGWGFQLQNPTFVVILAVVFFLFGLNLMGVFEVGTRLIGADTKVSQRNDIFGSFGMGVLAAVVGAPCMGPLVASVSGIAVQASLATGLLIFGVMGLGLASPFLLLSVFPKLVAYLPKPGVWMESFKQFMGFLLMAAVVFLALVVGKQGGVDAIVAILVVLLISALAAWIYGRWAAPVKSKRSKLVAILLSSTLLILAGMYGVNTTKAAYNSFEVGAVSDGDGWQPWSSERVTEELAAGNPVFIDFTASWCLICQVNKKVAVRTDATTALFEEYGIVTLEADWTRYDAMITTELERFGRSGVPLYVLYAPDGEVTVLPQSLTNGIIREAVEHGLK